MKIGIGCSHGSDKSCGHALKIAETVDKLVVSRIPLLSTSWIDWRRVSRLHCVSKKRVNFDFETV